MSSGGPSTPPQQSVPLSGLSSFPPETPRRCKEPAENGLQGTCPLTEDLAPAALGERLKTALNLTFDPDPWQLELISRLLHGFDGILCAGTGYGKSLVFEGLAVLGGKGKVVLVVCPLKALERDQVRMLYLSQVLPPNSGTIVTGQTGIREGSHGHHDQRRQLP